MSVTQSTLNKLVELAFNVRKPRSCPSNKNRICPYKVSWQSNAILAPPTLFILRRLVAIKKPERQVAPLPWPQIFALKGLLLKGQKKRQVAPLFFPLKSLLNQSVLSLFANVIFLPYSLTEKLWTPSELVLLRRHSGERSTWLTRNRINSNECNTLLKLKSPNYSQWLWRL